MQNVLIVIILHFLVLLSLWFTLCFVLIYALVHICHALIHICRCWYPRLCRLFTNLPQNTPKQSPPTPTNTPTLSPSTQQTEPKIKPDIQTPPLPPCPPCPPSSQQSSPAASSSTDTPTTRQEAGVAESAPPQQADPWKLFCEESLEEVLQHPFPAYNTTDPIVSLYSDVEEVQYLRQRYKHKQHLVDVAERFIQWAQNQPNGTSLLLRAEDDTDFWVIGDLHASFELLLRVWKYVAEQVRTSGRKACIVLLGDIIDRGEDALYCLGMLQEMLMSGEQEGIRLICLRGNHDAALGISADGSFKSDVKPAETVNSLNELRANDASAAESIGRAAMELARTAPVMAEITHLDDAHPDTCVLLTHGGVPHVDIQQEAINNLCEFSILSNEPLFRSLPDNALDKWVEDFIWIRMVDRLPHKRPNRGSHGNEMGTQDVTTYRRLHYRLTGRAISFIIRGHDHEPKGYRLYSYDDTHNPSRGTYVQKYCGVLTINTMQHNPDNALFHSAFPAIVRLRRNSQLLLHPFRPIPIQHV